MKKKQKSGQSVADEKKKICNFTPGVKEKSKLIKKSK